jgi:dipeptidase
MKIRPLLVFFAVSALLTVSVEACTNLLVTRGASTDKSVMITYTCDGEFHSHLDFSPAADYAAGDSLEITRWGGQVIGKIAQVVHTYAVVGLMNEHQLAIGETTFGGREELTNPDGLLHYWDLMKLGLQRARTAREAIEVMTGLVAEYGYRSSGESFSIADTKEAWILEMIGPGPGGNGALWVSRRVPDGYISAHANQSRIGEFPLDDRHNCLYAPNVIDFAVANGYYDPEAGQPFRYYEAYGPPTPASQRYADTRVWSIFRRAAPSLNLPVDYHRAVPGAEPYPLWIKPDEKISVETVFALMRDHYEGTAYDMRAGIDAGPYHLPYRWRPLSWEVDSVGYVWERPISTQQTAFSFVSQSRDWLPDPVGGVLWYGLDDTYATCYTPLYCCIDAIPASFTVGRLSRFSWESAWWVFNFVSNYLNLKYDYMVTDMQAVQAEIESSYLALQPAVEETAKGLYKKDRALMTAYLTDYSVSHAETMVQRWQALGEYLIRKYNDGYVQTEPGSAESKGYPDDWLRRVLAERPQQFHLPVKNDKTPESTLVD